MSFGGEVQMGKASCVAIADMIADEAVMVAGLVEAAAEPTYEAMKRNLEPHRRHDPSAVDSIGIVVQKGAPGQVAVAVGAVGDNALFAGDVLRAPQGDKDKGFILRFLERGTSKMSAFPWARPARDEVEPSVPGRLAAFLRRMMPSILGRAA